MFVPTRKKPTPANTGRKSAYVARNHAALLRASQRVLAEIGPEASIDQFAEAAEVSVSTIYKHFENKEALIEAANLGAFHDWEDWADAFVKETDDPLEELILPMRLFLRLKKTHPLYAKSRIAAADSHNEKVPCNPIGASPIPIAATKPGAAFNETVTGGTELQNLKF